MIATGIKLQAEKLRVKMAIPTLASIKRY